MATNILILQILTLSSISFPLISPFELDFPAVFNFGDSNSDTGGLVAGLGELLEPPNGEIYFHKPSGRFCDGRLIIDFLMDAMDLPFLNPYLEAVGAPSFKKGCNFAAAGSTILPATASSVSPFSFGIQVAQFIRFRARVLELLAESMHFGSIKLSTAMNGHKLHLNTGNLHYQEVVCGLRSVFHLVAGKRLRKFLPADNYFTKGLYMFDIGQNDLAGAFYSKSLDQVLASIPYILVGFENGVQKLYDQGARNFWIHNTGPLGCLAQNIAKFGADPSKLDELGCVNPHNQAAKVFNLQLYALCKKLQGQYPDANITYVDIFLIKSNMIANYTRYGFEQPLMVCCGFGGAPLNYDTRIACGQTKVLNGSSATVKGCSDSTEYINWDGIHYTEAANQHVSSQILTGKYSDPAFSGQMPFLLKLKF